MIEAGPSVNYADDLPVTLCKGRDVSSHSRESMPSGRALLMIHF